MRADFSAASEKSVLFKFDQPVSGKYSHYRHAVLGYGPGLVKADRLNFSQSFHGFQVPDNYPVGVQFADAQRQGRGGDCWKPLGDGGYGKRNGRFGYQRKCGPPNHSRYENKPANGPAHPNQLVADSIELFFHRGLWGNGFADHRLELSYFREAACCYHDPTPLSSGYQSARIDDIFAVGERNVGFFDHFRIF